jgi:predicted ArsR family transcriptional regulator
MADEKPVDRIRDPKRLRALAHPLRWKLTTLIDSEGTATATRCAEVLGESVASCSYHLNMLAKYDFVEEAPGGQGREKPWKLTNRRTEFSAEGLDLEGKLAAEAAAETFLDHEMEVLRQRLRLRDTEPAEWRKGTGTSSTTAYLTVEEATEVRRAIIHLMDRVEDRWENPELRPEGARQVRMFAAMFLNPLPPEHRPGSGQR